MSGKVDIKYTSLFIDNEFLEAENGATFETIDPSTEEVVAKVAFGSANDMNKAVNAAKKSIRTQFGMAYNGCFNAWKYNLPSRFFRYYAGYADKIHGSTIPVDGNFMSYTRKEPIGVVGQIIPWNYPVAMISWKWGPALTTGCTMVLKPAEQTPLSALHMASLVKEAGFPKGVINVVTGDGPQTGAALVKNLDVDKIAFTGSTEVGKLISSSGNDSNLKRISLELGGKSPVVVMNDCPSLDEAVEICQNAIFTYMGQVCCAGSRVFVQSGIYDEFNLHGPQVNQEQMDKILDLIDSGVKEGAKIETGGSRIGTKGYFVEPTVFSSVKDDMRIAKEEIFGPVQSIFKFETLNEVIDRANDTTYGLAAGIITSDFNTMNKFSSFIRAGTVWINCYNVISTQTPFGGFQTIRVWKRIRRGRPKKLFGMQDHYHRNQLQMFIDGVCNL
ncbi:ALDH [Lepeophtheirus salmonis]|uniref:aldehyde dehydrogenase (NAD(+)) n=1 Tax=Lepeophtheirus salmonis TaxID=72036 RepID=A0A7R8CFC6_LEPSM|nr:ALDH [Lepeophtheirus salmonis]CAF2805372.1 ALDH [Lepeophtheirus salmonis]